MCFDLPCGDVALAMFCAPATQPTPNPTHTFLKEEKRRPGQTPSAEDFKHEFCESLRKVGEVSGQALWQCGNNLEGA